MSKATLGQREMEIIMIAGAALVAFVAFKGVRGAAAAAAGAVVNVAGDVAAGTVDVVGQGIGLPALADITTDASVARWIIDNPEGGMLSASKWASAAAFAKAQFQYPGSGVAPPYGSKIAQVFPAYEYTSPEYGAPL